MRRPKVKLDNLVVFMAVADKHGIDGAAVELGLSPSGVRKQLDSIENTFGINLFEKRQGRMILSEDGELFYDDAAKAVEQAILAEEQIYARRAIRNRHLVLGHSTNLPPKVIAAVSQLHVEDDSPVRIEHKSGLTSTVLRNVLDGTMHAGFGILPIHAPNLLVYTIHEEPLVVCIPAGHKFATKPVISPQDLDSEPFIAISREPWPQRHQEIEDHCAGFGVSLRVVADAYSAPEALAYVQQNSGICLLPASSAIGRSGVLIKPLSTQVLKRRCGVFIREDNHSSPLLQKLIEAALEWAKPPLFKRDPVPVRLPIGIKEGLRKVKEISYSSPRK